MASSETIVLDSAGASPLTLTGGDPVGGVATYTLEGDIDLGLAARRPNWIGGGSSDGSLLVEDAPYDDATLAVTVRVWPAADTMDSALSALAALTQKLQECSASGPSGIACTYLAADSSNTYTWYAKLGEYDGPPPITPSGELAGWFLRKPVVKVKLTRDPFFYGQEIGTVTDDFSTNTIANYTFDTGGGTLSVSGGQLVPSDTAQKRFYRNLGGYDGTGNYYDTQMTLKVTTGASVASFSVGPAVKYLDGSNQLRLDQTNTNLSLVKRDVGANTTLATVASTLSTATSYWVRIRVEGNALTGELWTSAPTATGTPSKSVTATLAGGDATKFGSGIAGRVGGQFTPGGTDWRFDDLTIEPNVWVAST